MGENRARSSQRRGWAGLTEWCREQVKAHSSEPCRYLERKASAKALGHGCG